MIGIHEVELTLHQMTDALMSLYQRDKGARQPLISPS